METITARVDINYESLVKEYEDGLTSQLRGFRAGPDFLDTWTHDSDPRRSIVGLFEAARDGGVGELGLELSFETAKSLNFSSLGTELRHLGEVRVGTVERGTLLVVRFTS